MGKQPSSGSVRRSFLSRLNLGAASVAALAFGRSAVAQVKAVTPARWEPIRHEKDNWLDELPGKHRFVFDTTFPNGLADALVFANNFMIVNRNDYGLQNSDMAVVIVLRHFSTPFGFNDSVWAKYGAPMASMAKFEDPKSKAAPTSNLYNATGYGTQLPNMGTTLDALSKQGVQFAVCSMATRALAGSIARTAGGSADTINSELIANLVTSARMVPAGIVAINRAQERGYSLAVADRLS